MSSRITVKKVRLSFPRLFEARAGAEGQKPSFSVMLMIPKSDKETIKTLRAAEKEAAEEGKGKFGGKIPTNLNSIIHDGDDSADDYPEREGHWVMSVRSSAEYRPGVVDKNLQQITDQSEVYSGVYANVSVTPFAYNTNGNKGVSFGLNNVQILGYGESLAGGVKPEDEFEVEEVEEESLI